jgi:hypothetical protein
MTPDKSYPIGGTCRNGHPWETSAYIKKDGKRFCKVCNYARKKEKMRQNIKCPDRILTALERFEKRIDKTPGHGRNGDCWIWTALTTNGGYGILVDNYERIRTHRFAWELENGPIPEGMQVLHHCDNPPCCRVSHLFLGTDADNVADKIAKGRGPDMKAVSLYRQNPVGERNGRAILTWEIVRAIRDDRVSLGLSLSVLAKKYDTSVRTVSRIINNKNWKEERA